MLDITLSNFESDVLEASRRQPVLLDIWAPWCGPCRTLGPLLEKLEAAYAGRFSLAKLDSDAQPEIAGQLSQMFGVRSIPFCVLFQDGQPVDGFVGALPEQELRAFLDKHVPDAASSGAPESADLLGRELLQIEHSGDALTALRLALAGDPSNDALRFTCARALIQANRLAEAREVLDPVAGRGNPSTDDLAACGLWLEVCEQLQESGVPATIDAGDAQLRPGQEDHLDTTYRRAMTNLALSHFSGALDELLAILLRDKDWGGGRARTSFLAILRLLRASESAVPGSESQGNAAPTGMLTRGMTREPRPSAADSYHRRLSMILF